jgi:AraC-like DNA-binding protein
VTSQPIDEVLHSIRMQDVVYCRSLLCAPWGIAFPPLRDRLMFHAVSRGQCWIEVPGSPARLIRAGEVALLPHGRGHRLLSSPGQGATPLFDLPRRMLPGGIEEIAIGSGSDPAILLCAAAYFDDPIVRLLVTLFPDSLVMLSTSSVQDTGIAGTLELLEAEAVAPRVGTETVVVRLVELVVVQALREWSRRVASHDLGWMAALQDRYIARAVALMHRAPTSAWTLVSLAREVGLSRSALARRFVTAIGVPPMEYLTHLRMNVAMNHLRQPDATVAQAAAAAGFSSEAAFSRCFKRVIGLPPGSFRRSKVGVTPPHDVREAVAD